VDIHDMQFVFAGRFSSKGNVRGSYTVHPCNANAVNIIGNNCLRFINEKTYKKMTIPTKKARGRIATYTALILAVATAWLAVDWTTFALDFAHLMPLGLAALVAILGKLTELKEKEESKYEGRR